MLPQITAKLARFLGPKGLMPTARRGTVVNDVAGAIGGLEGKLEWKGDREGCIRVAIGRVSPSVCF
jgi:large subunit ribosomal protein L1